MLDREKSSATNDIKNSVHVALRIFFAASNSLLISPESATNTKLQFSNKVQRKSRNWKGKQIPVKHISAVAYSDSLPIRWFNEHMKQKLTRKLKQLSKSKIFFILGNKKKYKTTSKKYQSTRSPNGNVD